MTDELKVVLALESTNTVEGVLMPVRPVLFLRCEEGELEAMIHTHAVLGSDDPVGAPDQTSVRLRWGTAPAAPDSWSRSTNYQAAFAPDPRAFLEQLLAVPDLRFEFHPFDAAPRVAIFDARGLARHAPKLEAACPRPGPGAAPRRSVDTLDVVITPDQVFMESVVEEKPEILSGPPPAYPDLLRQAGVQGRVTVQMIIDTTGRAEPSSVKVIQSPNPGFDQNAKTYALTALFRPGRVHGRAVRVLVNLPIDFKLKPTQ
jgi:TonB family protein